MKLRVLEGPNFSGRTDRLRQWVGLPCSPVDEATCNGNAYIGLDPSANLSGLAPTVRTEFELLAADSHALSAAEAALEDLGFSRCLDRNPFTLSGGEQVVAAILGALAARPARLAIDCALEQLSPATRAALLAHLEQHDIDVMIADNRLGEWFYGVTEPRTGTGAALRLQPDLFSPERYTSAAIELVDVSFSYQKGQPVFEGLNLTLEPGCLHLLKGANGSGKSTLCKILSGLLQPTSGEIRLDGKPIKPWKKPGSLTRYHYQDPDLQLFATRVSAQLPPNSRNLAAALGIGHLLDEHPLDLPYVLRKRLAIGCAAGGGAPLVALDEPTLGQDDEAAGALRQIAQKLAGLVISHSNVFIDAHAIELAGQHNG
jgi:energy-coupling factor transporter ATP-binding protein EcfA2